MGAVYWITGLSGAGKTTIGKLFYEKLKAVYANTVFLDGDVMREVFGADLGYSREDRLKCAMRYARLCRMLGEQDVHVVCCTISMFEDVRRWNRKNIRDYREIYIKVSMETLCARDKKGLYSGKAVEKGQEVTGIQIPFEEPENPDLVLVNEGEIPPAEQAEAIGRFWNLW